MENNNTEPKPMPNIKDLIGANLAKFKIKKMFEVYKHSTDRNERGSLGFFQTEVAANIFAEAQGKANWHQVKAGFVLTDGIVGFRIYDEKPVILNKSE